MYYTYIYKLFFKYFTIIIDLKDTPVNYKNMQKLNIKKLQKDIALG